MPIRHYSYLYVSLILFFWVMPAKASPITINDEEYEGLAIGRHLGILIDDSNRFRFDEIRSDAYQEKFIYLDQDSHVFGVNDATFWIKIDFNNTLATARELILEFRHALTDSVQFFEPVATGYETQFHGDRVLNKKQQISHRTPVFRINLPPGNSTYYLKIDTEGSVFVPLYLWSPDHFFRYQRIDSYMLGVIFGFIIVMLMYNLFLAISFQSRTYFYYSLYLAIYGVAQLGLLGLATEVFAGKVGIWLNNSGFLTLTLCAIGCITIFTLHFLNISKKDRFFYWFLNLSLAVSVTCIPITIFGGYSSTARFIPIYMLITSILMTSASSIYALRGYRPAKYYTIAWISFFIGTAATGLRFMGVIPNNFFTVWSIYIGTCIQLVLMSIALADRVNDIRDKAQEKINKLNQSLQNHIERVEEMVEERTETIRTILDNVKSGLLLVNKELTIEPGFSKSCSDLFPKIETGMSFLDCLQLKGRTRDLIELSLTQVFDDLLPEEASLNSLRQRISIGERFISLDGSAVRNQSGKVVAVLLTVVDATKLQHSEVEAQHNRMLLKILRYSQAFHDFVHEVHESIEKIKESIDQNNSVEAKSILHTLKGNFSIYAMDDIVHLIHDMEEKNVLDRDRIAAIEDRLQEFLASNKEILGIDLGSRQISRVQVNEQDIFELINLSRQVNDQILKTQFNSILANMRSIPIEQYLGPIEEEVERLSQKFAKLIRFEIAGKQLSVPDRSLKPIFDNIVHLIRNAVDHGIEDEREAVGKSAEGLIRLSFSQTAQNFEIKLEDDGKGLDLDQLCQRAIEKSIISPESLTDLSKQEKMRLILHENFSTRDEVDLISGRGIGLKAVHNVVQACNAQLWIDSEVGKGTSFTITVPLHEDQYAA